VAFEHTQAATVLEIPYTDRFVPRTRNRSLAIGTPSDAFYAIGVAFEHTQAATVLEIPYSDRVVPRTRKRSLAIGTPSDA
jgi:hypothetical protein